jgi:hypothetical protein
MWVESGMNHNNGIKIVNVITNHNSRMLLYEFMQPMVQYKNLYKKRFPIPVYFWNIRYCPWFHDSWFPFFNFNQYIQLQNAYMYIYLFI